MVKGEKNVSEGKLKRLKYTASPSGFSVEFLSGIMLQYTTRLAVVTVCVCMCVCVCLVW